MVVSRKRSRKRSVASSRLRPEPPVIFLDECVGGAKKSLAISVRLQPRERTLTEAEIEAVSEKVIASVAKATGGVLRA